MSGAHAKDPGTPPVPATCRGACPTHSRPGFVDCEGPVTPASSSPGHVLGEQEPGSGLGRGELGSLTNSHRANPKQPPEETAEAAGEGPRRLSCPFSLVSPVNVWLIHKTK